MTLLIHFSHKIQLVAGHVAQFFERGLDASAFLNQDLDGFLKDVLWRNAASRFDAPCTSVRLISKNKRTYVARLVAAENDLVLELWVPHAFAGNCI
jgi:hypothetical protein